MAGRKRFSRSGHTVHHPTAPLPPAPYPTGDYPTGPYPSAPSPPAQYPTAQYPTAQYPTAEYPTPEYPTAPYPTGDYPSGPSPAPPSPPTEYRTEHYPSEPYPAAPQPPYEPAAPPYQPAAGPPPGGFGTPTYHHVAGASAAAPVGGASAGAARPKDSVTRILAQRTVRGAQYVTRRVISASEADGARESGLTALIWNQVLSYGTDAMITVALAGTVFFGASPHAQRGNVLLYLLFTMAPFAVIAPVIGPALDRIQQGRRWAMAASSIGRGILALIMAMHPTDLVVLYPCALGSLVFSKGYSVVRGAAAPRLVPRGLTLVEANARLSIFGLGAALVGGGIVGALIKVTGSYSLGLFVTAAAFMVGGYSAFRLPKQVESSAPARLPREEPARPRSAGRTSTLARLAQWARRGFAPAVITSLQGVSTLRFLSGFLTMFMAFYIEQHAHGFAAALDLGALGLAAGAGNFCGTGIGSRLKLNRPELLVMICIGAAAGMAVLAAALFSILLGVVTMFVSAVGNSLAKVALDAVIQRDVVEELRSSAFGRSETFLQLAWVVGAAVGVAMPAGNGVLAFAVVGGVLAVTVAAVVLRHRAMGRGGSWQVQPGNVGP